MWLSTYGQIIQAVARAGRVASPGIRYSARLSNMSMHSLLDGVELPWGLRGRGM
jgi:hypothetical protein